MVRKSTGSPYVEPMRKKAFASVIGRENLNKSQPEMFKRAKMSGTSEQEVQKALKTYMSDVGPGQYGNPDLTGRYLYRSKMSNAPSVKIGLPRQRHSLNPENRKIISSPHKTPSCFAYRVPSDNINFTVTRANLRTSERKFFEQKNMPALRSQWPV